MSVRRYKLIFILVFFIQTSAANDPHPTTTLFQPWPAGSSTSSGFSFARTGRSSQGTPDKNRPLFSPRMEYNEWLPVGRGDPLKNDPTYDYSPPVLDRVRYWSENLANKDKGNDILLLGVPSKKASNSKAIVEQQQQQSQVQPPWGSNSGGPMRRNYYHHQINQLPTVLMPPPLNNHLQPDGGDGYLWTQASTHQAQRYEVPQGEGFRYRQPPQPHPGHSFQYQSPKYTEPPMYHMNSFHHQAQSPPHPSQQYTTTLRLTTPNDIGHGSGSKKPILHTILQNEKAYPFTKTAMTNTITEYTSSSFYNPQNINAMATTIIHPPQTTEYLTPESTKVFPTVSTSMKAPFVTPANFVPPMTSTTTTTTSTTMRPAQQTMDPVLAQFNQPPRPVAPLYLIIEGHSKVKTYGLNNNDTLMQLPKLVPVIGSEDPVIRHVVSRDDTGDALQVPHVTMKPSTTTTTTTTTTATPPTSSTTTGTPTEPSSDEETSEEKSAVNSILSLLDASFGNYLLNGESGGNSLDSREGDKDSKARRNARSVPDPSERHQQEVYVIGSFQVGEQPEAQDGYRRGVVFDETSASIDRDAFRQ